LSPNFHDNTKAGIETVPGRFLLENELQILNSIGKNENTTQRYIAKNTGISLGTVNVLIKRLVKKGLIKIEKMNTRTIKYILTPQGLKEKARITYRYIAASYKFISEIDSKINRLLKSQIFTEAKNIYLFGENDDIYKLLQNHLMYNKILYKHISTMEEIKADILICRAHPFILVWQPDYMELLTIAGIDHMDLLEMV
jgi:DNA-binding MarR family transcriptional regulator